MEGCIVLGTKAQRGNRYVTRFRIDPVGQQRSAREGICAKECYPCLRAPEEEEENKNRSRAGKFLWDVVRSEAFLLTLHVSVLILGVLKEALNLREVDEDLHLVHSVVETFVSCNLAIIRIVSAWHAFKDLRLKRKDFEVISDHHTLPLAGLRKALVFFTSVATVLIIGDIIAFFIFKFVPGAHLGWTILTNNALLLYITVSSNQILSRITRELGAIELDHHKAILYETMLLMTELSNARDKNQLEEVQSRVDLFYKALRDTAVLSRPDYIECPQSDRPHWDAITSMEVVSMV